MESKDIARCSSLSGLKVLVTGGAGFVGSHVCETLLESDCDITVLDAFLHAARADTSRVAPDQWFSSRSVRTIRADLRDRKAVRAVLKSTLPDIVIHLAALPLLTAARDNPDLTVAINVDGTRNLLEELAVPGTVRRFVYVSSSSVYGHFRYRPVDEGHPTEPTEVYGRTKLIGEQLTRLFCSARGVEYVVLRPSAAYGPGDRNRRVVQLFLEQALVGQPLPIDGDGTECLDFTYVKDLATGIALAAFAEGAGNETFNISRGEERSILDLAEVVRCLIRGVSVVHRQTACPRPSRGRLSIEKAHNVLGYRPRFSLEAGLADYLALLDQGLAEAL